jgi:CheY-like chemotaxis protein
MVSGREGSDKVMRPEEDVVLVVDDEDDARVTMTQLLELEGFKVFGARHGLEALEYLEKSDLPCVIVTDIRMPVMDGVEFRKALLGDARLARIPVIVVTGLDPFASAALGAQRVFRKPVNVEALVAAVRQNC